MDTKKQILDLVQNDIKFFQDNWEQFCQIVEDYGAHVDRCRNDPACEYDMDAETKRDQRQRELNVNHCNVIIALNKATQSGDREKAKRLDQQVQKIEQELSEIGPTMEPEPGCERYNFHFLYLNIPMAPIFWIRPAVNPLDWLLRQCPLEDDLSEKDRLVYACALLSIVHDDGNLIALEKRVLGFHTTYQGKYFKRSEFCKAVLSNFRENPDSIYRAFNRVKAQLPTGNSEQGDAKKGRHQKYTDEEILTANKIYKKKYSETKDSKSAWNEVVELTRFSNPQAARKTITLRMKQIQSEH